MDIEANIAEQKRVSSEILKIWDKCPASGIFTDAQRENLIHGAGILAQLVEAYHNHKR